MQATVDDGFTSGVHLARLAVSLYSGSVETVGDEGLYRDEDRLPQGGAVGDESRHTHGVVKQVDYLERAVIEVIGAHVVREDDRQLSSIYALALAVLVERHCGQHRRLAVVYSEGDDRRIKVDVGHRRLRRPVRTQACGSVL